METDLNNYVMFFVSLLTSLSIASKRNLLLSYSVDKGLAFALLAYFVLFIGFYPIKYGSDKYVYKIVNEDIVKQVEIEIRNQVFLEQLHNLLYFSR